MTVLSRSAMCMLDQQDRLPVWNERFIELLHLQGAPIHVGMRMPQLIRHSIRAGNFKAKSVKQVIRDLAGGLRQDKFDQFQTSPDGDHLRDDRYHAQHPQHHHPGPTTSDATGANSDSISAARISVGSSASALRVWSSFVISMWLARLPRCRRSYVAKLNMMQTAQPIGGIDERVAKGGVTISIKLFRIARPVTMLIEQKPRLSKWNSEAPRENFFCS
jgi:PAS fold